MQLPDKSPDLWAQIFAWLASVKEQGIAAGLAGLMAYLRAKYEGDGGWKSLLDALICSMFGWFIKDILSIIGANTDFAYFASVVVGYLGTKYIGSKIKAIADRKTGDVK